MILPLFMPMLWLMFHRHLQTLNLGLEPLERYDGDREICRPFITNCSLLFTLQSSTFTTEEANVVFVITYVTSRACVWGTAEWERHLFACASFEWFAIALHTVFGLESCGADVSGGLIGLRQGAHMVVDNSIDFLTKASQSSWNSSSLCDAFHHRLADYIKDELFKFIQQ